METARLSLICIALLVGIPAALAAGEEESDYPGIVEIGTTLTALAGSGDSVEAEHGMAFDVYTAVPTRTGGWSLLVEAATHPMSSQLSRGGLPADGQESWRAAYSGEAHLAELHYSFQALGGAWSIGLLDSKLHIDGSGVANDDKEQFLGAAFVNNPSIALPENSLGFAYRREPGPGAPGYTLLTTARETDDAGTGLRFKGLFLAAETFRDVGSMMVRLGVWGSRFSQSAGAEFGFTGESHGLYASMDGQFNDLAWNARAGTARFDAGAEETYIGLATQIPIRQSVLGIGVGHSARTGNALTGAAGHSNHLEVYYRFTALGRFVITPDMQYRQITGAAGSEGVFSVCVRLRIVI